MPLISASRHAREEVGLARTSYRMPDQVGYHHTRLALTFTSAPYSNNSRATSTLAFPEAYNVIRGAMGFRPSRPEYPLLHHGREAISSFPKYYQDATCNGVPGRCFFHCPFTSPPCSSNSCATWTPSSWDSYFRSSLRQPAYKGVSL